MRFALPLKPGSRHRVSRDSLEFPTRMFEKRSLAMLRAESEGEILWPALRLMQQPNITPCQHNVVRLLKYTRSTQELNLLAEVLFSYGRAETASCYEPA
jgi:hypothetical protein